MFDEDYVGFYLGNFAPDNLQIRILLLLQLHDIHIIRLMLHVAKRISEN